MQKGLEKHVPPKSYGDQIVGFVDTVEGLHTPDDTHDAADTGTDHQSAERPINAVDKGGYYNTPVANTAETANFRL